MLTIRHRVQHNSLQFSDGPKQQRKDVQKIFQNSRTFPVKTGTESGPERGNDNRELLMEFAEKFNHVIHFGGDNWVAVDRDIVRSGTVRKGEVFLADNRLIRGRGHDRIMPWIAFDHVVARVGRIHQGAVHYPTRGAEKGSPNHEVNIQCAQRIAEWMKDVGQGPDLAFVNGDFNMNDRTLDVALGRNFTTMADELNAHQNTGHGPIDGLCSYDRDRRVKAAWFRVLDDKKFHLFSDHFTCRGAWDIKLQEA